jgi:hypothetical protein
VYWKVARDTEVRELLDEYRATAKTVHKLELEEVPENVIENLQRRTDSFIEQENFLEKIYFALFSKPILSSAVIGITVLLLTSLFIFKQPTPSHKYTKGEIELAQKQLGESLAIVNKVFQKTSKKIDGELIPNHVSKPLNKGLNLINDYLVGG